MTPQNPFLCCRTDERWLAHTLARIRDVGCALITGAIPPDMLAETSERLRTVQQQIRAEIGEERLERAGELGVLRLMMRFDRFFTRYLEIPEMLAIVDATVSPTAILHLQNGFILPSHPRGTAPEVFQNNFHMDFRRLLNGYLASINVFIAISEFTVDNGSTLVVPGSHQKTESPDRDSLARDAVALTCPAGTMIVFDSTLWHASGRNVSGFDRLAINHQFTRSWIKPQIDHVRALGDDMLLSLPERSRQLLGWSTRVVTSLDEYYQPPEKRLYRAGQG
jgi:ectoine hydroxylase-related dioxygenase (phytanoyl-CoA dioxygenase family)